VVADDVRGEDIDGAWISLGDGHLHASTAGAAGGGPM
jgi:hypothetical protein